MHVARPTRGTPDQHDLARFLPRVALATFAVLGLPAIAAAWLQAALDLHAVLSMLCAVLLSLIAASIGSAYWMRRPESRNLVFGDLMVWGWLRRMRAERRLSEASELLGEDGLDAEAHAEVLTRLASGLESRDPYTFGHSRRVTRFSEMIAERMGLSEAEIAKVRTAAAVHDVGKINTPRAVLMKPGRLTEAEFAVIQRHATEGAAMVAAIGDADITAMVLHHHERLDGSGYPQGVSGDDVPVGARIIAVADTFDAMTSSRPYRPARPHKKAMEILDEEAGTKLDARAVTAFQACYSGRRSIAWSALAVAAPQRLASWAGGALGSGGAAPLTTGLAALGAAGLLGGSVLGPPARGEEESRSAPEASTQVTPAAAAAGTGIDAPEPARPGGPGEDRRAPGAQVRSLPGGSEPAGGDAYQGPAGAPPPGSEVAPKSPGPDPDGGQQPAPPPPPPPVAPTVPDAGPLPGLSTPEIRPLPRVGNAVDDLGQSLPDLGLGETVDQLTDGLGLPGLGDR
ncbi:MAG TPA: HD-GYP domain-containing protein [Thermoleophilaceae bacterium]|nr:HD-GYP domain-containing protein [Thermoleophilaceae bacterium]